MKKIAVITGASSGIGKQFAQTLKEAGDFDEVWLIARRIDRLQELVSAMPFPARAIALDLSEKSSYKAYAALLEEEKPNVALLINAAGFGKFCATVQTPVEVNLNMIDLNCEAVAALCQLSIPYMQNGAHIVNVASVAAYQPIPYINVYGATKSFVLHYSRALNRELKQNGIAVTAVCPFWTKTEFFNRAIDKEKDTVVKKYVVTYTPEQIVSKAWRDIKKGKEISMFGFTAQTQTLLAKLLPHGFVMNYWMHQQKLK